MEKQTGHRNLGTVGLKGLTNPPTPPAGWQVLYKDLASGHTSRKNPDGTMVDLETGGAAGGPGIPRPGAKRWAYIIAHNNATAPHALGDDGNQTGSASVITPDANDGVMLNLNSINANGSGKAGVFGELIYRVGRNIYFQARLKLQQTGFVRFFAGISDGNPAAGSFYDESPALNRAGFFYSTSLGHSNWMVVTNNGGVTQNVEDTTVAVDTSSHLFEIAFDDSAGNIKFSIDNILRKTVTAALPASGTNVQYAAFARELESALKHIRYGFIYLESDR